MIEKYIMKGNIIPSSICDMLIERSKELEWEKHLWHNNNRNEFHDRDTEGVVISYMPDDLCGLLHPLLHQLIREYQKTFCGKTENTKNEFITKITRLRFNKYAPGSLMKEHHDHIHSIFDGNEKGIPILSIVGNLNDDFEGSEFICRDKRVAMSKGDVIIFPSNFMFPHRVTSCLKGERISFVGWGY